MRTRGTAPTAFALWAVLAHEGRARRVREARCAQSCPAETGRGRIS